MFHIVSNRQIGKEIYLMEVEKEDKTPASGEPGQFYMVHLQDSFMVLGRPISIMDIQGSRIFFLYQVVGKGTGLFSRQKPGTPLILYGPYGRSYPIAEYKDKKTALIGGGMGVAPLLFAARYLKEATLYLGFNSSVFNSKQEEEFHNLFSKYGKYQLHLDVDMTEKIVFEHYEAVMTCGPEIMMRKVVHRHPNVYVSMERHMGCGTGACMSCTCKAQGKRVRVCKEGPVFHESEVDWDA